MNLLRILNNHFIYDISDVIGGYFPNERDGIGMMIKYGTPIDCFDGRFDINEIFRYACQYEILQIMSEIYDKKHDVDWNYGLYGACFSGCMRMIKYTIEKGANDWNWGLYEACHGGHIEVIEFMIRKGANNYYWGLEGACRGDQIEAVELMIEMGADNWNWGLYNACHIGSIKIAKLMIEKGARNITHVITITKDPKVLAFLRSLL